MAHQGGHHMWILSSCWKRKSCLLRSDQIVCLMVLLVLLSKFLQDVNVHECQWIQLYQFVHWMSMGWLWGKWVKVDRFKTPSHLCRSIDRGETKIHGITSQFVESTCCKRTCNIPTKMSELCLSIHGLLPCFHISRVQIGSSPRLFFSQPNSLVMSTRSFAYLVKSVTTCHSSSMLISGWVISMEQRSNVCVVLSYLSFSGFFCCFFHWNHLPWQGHCANVCISYLLQELTNTLVCMAQTCLLLEKAQKTTAVW